MNPFATAALLAIAIAQLSMAYLAAQPTPELETDIDARHIDDAHANVIL